MGEAESAAKLSVDEKPKEELVEEPIEVEESKEAETAPPPKEVVEEAIKEEPTKKAEEAPPKQEEPSDEGKKKKKEKKDKEKEKEPEKKEEVKEEPLVEEKSEKAEEAPPKAEEPKEEKKKEKAPKISAELKDQTVTEGSEVKFTCKAKGHPTPDVKWQFNGKDIEDNSIYKLSSDGEKYTLKIKETKVEYTGTYTVKVNYSCVKIFINEYLGALYFQTIQVM